LLDTDILRDTDFELADQRSVIREPSSVEHPLDSLV